MHACRVAIVAASLFIGATVPALAQAMPPTGSPPPPGAQPAGDAGPDRMNRDELFLTAGLGAGQDADIVLEIQVGWMLRPWLGAFVSRDLLLGQYTDTSLDSVGVRLTSGPLFAEGGIAAMTLSRDCCATVRSHVGLVGGGLELLHLRHFALDVHARVIADGVVRGVRVFGGFSLGLFM